MLSVLGYPSTIWSTPDFDEGYPWVRTVRAAIGIFIMIEKGCVPTRYLGSTLHHNLCCSDADTNISHIDPHYLPLHRSQFRSMDVRHACLHRQFTSELAVGGPEEARPNRGRQSQPTGKIPAEDGSRAGHTLGSSEPRTSSI